MCSKAAARACEWWCPGGEVEVGVAQFEGGDTGRELSALLTQRSIRVVAQPVAAPTRVCTTLLSKGEAEGVEVTELVEPGGEVGRGGGGWSLDGRRRRRGRRGEPHVVVVQAGVCSSCASRKLSRPPLIGCRWVLAT